MARTVRVTEEELQQALKVRDEATTATEFRKAMTVILMAKLGLDPVSTAELLGSSRCTTFRDRLDIRSQGDSQKSSWGGRRHFTMTLNEEREFLVGWEAEAKSGGVLAVPPIHAALVERLGRDISPSHTYRMLARHGWRKVQPDTKHPKSDPVAQDEFKKNSQRLWLPPV
jgi:hypothetical protein